MISIVTALSSCVRTFLQHFLREGECDVLARQRRVGDEADERSLELPDVRLDLAGDVDRHVVRERNGLGLGLLLENRDLGLEIRRLDVGDEPPLEPRPQPLLDVPGSPAAGSRC